MQYVLSITEINRYIKEIISRDLVLSNLWVRGEISNYKNHYSGHMYFTVKDEFSTLKCVMFKSNNSQLGFTPENGMKVLIRGYLSVFERDGQYQLYAQEMQPDGLGNLHLAYEQLKLKLQMEGLFDEKYKKPIPFLPKCIGVVTSSSGAVIRDIIHVLSRRFGNVELKIYPVAVQGEGACHQIAKAIKRLNDLGNVDVIIVARGGGSLEELWAFNEEVVARSIFDSKIPVVSAVGHETDFTIADFVADLRAPTPSAAAELVVPEKASLENRLSGLSIRLSSAMERKLEATRSELEQLKNSPAFRQPYARIYEGRMQIDVLHRYMLKGLQLTLEKSKARFAVTAGKLDTLSPLTVLARGYSVSRSLKSNEVIASVTDVNVGDEVEIALQDGALKCQVTEICKNSPGLFAPQKQNSEA